MPAEPFRVLMVDLTRGRGEYINFGDKNEHLGGSGLAAALFAAYADVSAPALAPEQPLIFAIGPLTGCYPLMSKTVCAFKSPYNEQYAESHAGGRLALSLRFAGIDALVIRGRSPVLSALAVGIRRLDFVDVHFLRGFDVFTTGKQLRKLHRSGAGHRSTLRIGPAGENQVAYACINVDTYRHFGRLGSGAVMGAKNLKAIVIDGGKSLPAPAGKDYPDVFKAIYDQVVDSGMMKKYHDLGTPENLLALNELSALPWKNLQSTKEAAIENVSGEAFARDLLLRKAACAGCPVGCIHVGLLREKYAANNDYLYRQVSYDYEPLFADGTMLGITSASGILAVMDEIERQGVDCMSAGVALAWATEAAQKGAIGLAETIVPLAFDDVAGYREAVRHLGNRTNEFYRLLGQGTMVAAAQYKGEDYACVLGQEMSGYATGEVFYISQAMGVRHSHLDSGGYSYDQKHTDKDAVKAIDFLVADEADRVALTSMVSCLFARNVYTPETLGRALSAMGLSGMAENLGKAARNIQKLRWKNKIDCGFKPREVKIPKRFYEVTNWKGQADPAYLEELKTYYASRIEALVSA
ncbi:MAG: aldehyde ferredoxin oxidoreductase [Desulfovibrionaceae bacterium]|nr:aldehyde ferredoxin oxidoreductase [Desulfovibrionaceae bacterium]MBF0513994.1 aldehyde ferredoxin oxidoreductase [Desulfovibrionaceae bacterium]